MVQWVDNLVTKDEKLDFTLSEEMGRDCDHDLTVTSVEKPCSCLFGLLAIFNHLVCIVKCEVAHLIVS